MVVGVHDAGKVDPLHQGQLLTRRRHEFFDFLAGLNLPLPDAAWLERAVGAAAPGVPSRRYLRHEALSGHILDRSGFAPWLCAAVSGHHGRYLPDIDRIPPILQQHHRFLDVTSWRGKQDEVLIVLRDVLELSSATPIVSLNALAGPLIPLVTGLICLADWLASDEAFLRHEYLALLDAPRDYFVKRLADAAAHVEDCLGTPVARCGDFGRLFGFSPSRPAQQWATNAEHGPGLAVVAVPMGEGKTETALWRHAARPDLRDGLLFALPTTATADAMFTRILDFYGGQDGYAHLGHGRAVLNAFYRPSAAQPVGICDSDDHSGESSRSGLRPGSWFSGPHRVLTAPVGVVTCDQVLAAAVSHKFAPVRLASLAGKHVVLDEVHTYDPYQDRLLRRVLGWLGFFRVRVTLLSATLPARRLRDYVRAYLAGWHGFRDAAAAEAPIDGLYPAVTVTTGEGVVEQHQLPAWRSYTHQLSYAQVPGGAAFNVATVDLVERARAADPGARIGVIVNRVDRAIDVASKLRERGLQVLLLHARMTYAQRAQATARLLAAVGKNSPAGPLTVVATSIAEASLDIDLDVLFSDLAPMASLLQRAGRQWRHSTPVAGGWVHPLALAYRRGDPVLHILVPMEGSEIHPQGHYPYTRAEILRTWLDPCTLAGGGRTELRIPEDVQAAVDRADVSIADLLTDPADAVDPQLSAALTAHVVGMGAKATAAERVGIEAEVVDRAWRAAMRDEDGAAWAGVAALEALTQGRMWREDAVTRLREIDGVQLLLYDPEAANPYAWHGDLSGLLLIRDRQSQLAVLDQVIPVSGSLATTLRKIAMPNVPANWHPLTLLRNVIPLAVTRLPHGCRLTNNGLEFHRGG